MDTEGRFVWISDSNNVYSKAEIRRVNRDENFSIQAIATGDIIETINLENGEMSEWEKGRDDIQPFDKTHGYAVDDLSMLNNLNDAGY